MNAPSKWVDAHKSHQGNECLFWPYSRNDRGYAQFKIKGKAFSAVHLMCSLVHGKPPTPEHHAGHSCENGRHGCMNPGHLGWARYQQNEDEKLIHGTGSRGAKKSALKLRLVDVKAIRLDPRKHQEIADDYGVVRQHISKIKRRKQWAWLA